MLLAIPIFCSCDSASKFISSKDNQELTSIRELNSSLKPGSAYDTKLMPKIIPAGHWVKIPKWLAGVWASEDFTLYYNADQNGHISKETKRIPYAHKQSFGHKKDKEGNIWHCTLIPFMSDQTYTEDSAAKQITWKAPAYVGDDSVSFTFYNTTIDVNKKSGTINDISKNISKQTYSLKNDNQLLCVTNQFGKSLLSGKYRKKTRMQFFKKSEFKDVDKLEGVNLDKSFASFIK